MLDLALQLKPAIIRYGELDKRFKFGMNSEEWAVLTTIAGHLKVFYAATLKMSGSKYPTLNLFFSEFCEVYLAIKKMESSEYHYVVDMAKQMLAKWQKYWEIGNALLALACILDPRHKMAAIEYYLKMMYPGSYVGYVANFKNCLQDLYKQYLQLEPKGTASAQTRGATSSSRLLFFTYLFTF